MAGIRWHEGVRIGRAIFFLSLFLPGAPLTSYAKKPFMIEALSSVQYEVKRPRNDLRAFDGPEFIARHLPGLKGISTVEKDLLRWDLEIKVPLAKRMAGSFPARRKIVNPDLITYETPDKKAPDYMFCETFVKATSARSVSIKITLYLRFTRSSGWKFHWLAPFVGEKFLGAKVKERLDGMLAAFVESSKKEFEAPRPA